MTFKAGKSYQGFVLKRQKRIEEINSTGRVFYHAQSGAKLLYLTNDDDNMVFSISLRTPPGDSTGIPHIIEHSVLCGSRKFPLKEPFVELAKGSLNTFLNAMTFSDKTMYPVASRNNKDFYNLMDVYLDAVFYPNIYTVPGIFMQEGWHYEMENNEEITYRGVVYNEMKGVFSTPEAVLFRKIPESLFPDTPYGFESGGDPEVIPHLTIEQFLSFHKKYYHPSNSYIFLYGNGDILRHLQFLHDHYLKDFEKMGVPSKIDLQSPFINQKELKASYPILPHEEERDKTFFSLNFVIDKATNPEISLAVTILEYLLLETPAAPLKKALMDEQMGKDVFGQFEKDMLQPIFSIVVKNSNENQKQKFQNTVCRTLEKLVEHGIDKKIVEAAINIHEFRLREADFRGLPKGVVYCIGVMGSWLYDGDPFMHLEYERNLQVIKKALSAPYFEQLIDKYLLKNMHRSLLVVGPEKGLAERKAEEIRKLLADYRSGLSEAETDSLKRETAELKSRQMTPDPQEIIEKIPLLSLGDINPEAEKLPLEESEEGGIKVLFHPHFTSSIAYLNLFFDTSSVLQEDLPYLSLLAQMLGRVSTRQYSYADLSNQILIHTGGINFSNETFGDKDDDNLYFPKLLVQSKSLVKKLPELCDLTGEILGHTRFDDKKRLREIIQETKSRFEMSIYDQGHFIASGRLLSYFSPKGKYAEWLGGISFFRFIDALEREFEKRADEIIHKLNTVSAQVFNRKNLITSITTETGCYSDFQNHFSRILDCIDDRDIQKAHYRFDMSVKNEGLLTPGKVQFVAQGFNYRKLGYTYNGNLQVLRSIASLDYLWNHVRVRGGAYGCFARFYRDGTMYFCSYRDPNLKETLDVYNHAPIYLRSFDADEREITKYIIGTISKLDHPLTPSMKGETAAERFLQNISYEDVQKSREEILRTGKKDIQNCADLVDEAMKKNFLCVLGNEGKIKENRELFSSLVNVF